MPTRSNSPTDCGRYPPIPDPATAPNATRGTVVAMTAMPALSVIGTPDKRNAILELAAEAERRGFAGLASPGVHGNLACADRWPTSPRRIPFWTSIQPIYHCHPVGGRDHCRPPPRGQRRPLPARPRRQPRAGDEPPRHQHRQAVARHGGVRRGDARRPTGPPVPLPPIYLATLRDKMLDLALAEGRRRDLGQCVAPLHADADRQSPGRRPRRLLPVPTWCRR